VCNYVAALGVLLKVSGGGAHDAEQAAHLVVVGDFECALDDVVGLGVSHEFHDFGLGFYLQDFVDDFPALARVAVHQTLFNHVGGILALTHVAHFAFDRTEHLLFLVHRAELEDVLDGLVTVLVFRKLVHEREDLIDDGLDDAGLAVLEHALDHATAVRMHRQPVGVVLESGDQLLHDVFLLAQELDDLLDHMVAVLVLHELHDVVFDLESHDLLLVGLADFDGLLHHAAALHVHCELMDVPQQLVGQCLFVALVSVLEQPLDDLVAERVHCQCQNLRN